MTIIDPTQPIATDRVTITPVEHAIYCQWAGVALEEGVLDYLKSIPAAIKAKVSFIADLAKTLKIKLSDLIALFRNSFVWKFFTAIGWSLKQFFGLLQVGLKVYRALLDAIAQYVANTGVGKWTEAALLALDGWLQRHPILARLGGVGVGALLAFIWFRMTFTGDVIYDFGMDNLLAALAGKYSLAKLFAGKDGAKLLMLFATGMFTGLTFPWPGPANLLFIGGVIQTLARKVKANLSRSTAPTEESLAWARRVLIDERDFRAEYQVYQEAADKYHSPPEGIADFVRRSVFKDFAYHGTSRSLAPGHSMRLNGSEYGIFVSPRRRYASIWGPKLYKVLVDMRRPLIVADKSEISPRDLTHADAQALRTRGFDGIVSSTSNNIASAAEFVLFDPAQVWVIGEV